MPLPRVTLAGGCGLNSVANGKIFEHTPFKETAIQPAAGDDGLAIGAALYISQAILQAGPRHRMPHAYLGSQYDDVQIQEALKQQAIPFRRLEREALSRATACAITKGKIVGWFQGRMEWSQRALGSRSILAHPGLPQMKALLNERIKHREPFRPFAPSVLVERLGDIFMHDHPSPFMLHVYAIRPEWQERLCAVNHINHTGRLQSVTRKENPLYYDLISCFEQQTDLPVVLNTSFNENERIVSSPKEVIDCFQRTHMDVHAIGPFFCQKEPL